MKQCTDCKRCRVIYHTYGLVSWSTYCAKKDESYDFGRHMEVCSDYAPKLYIRLWNWIRRK